MLGNLQRERILATGRGAQSSSVAAQRFLGRLFSFDYDLSVWNRLKNVGSFLKTTDNQQCQTNVTKEQCHHRG